MANIRKFCWADSAHMFTHYRRGARNYGNSDVDTTRSHLNYNVGPDRPQSDHLLDLLDEVKHSNRKDLVVMCDWVINAPSDLSEEMYDDFFHLCYQFCVDRYGSQSGLPLNEDVVLSSYVHLDETTPHMHFCFAPIKEIDGEPKFLAKEVVSVQELRTFHQDLQNYLRDNGCRCSILNGKTKRDAYGRALSVKELKRQDYLREREGLERGRW